MSDDNGENSSLSEYIVRVRGLPWSAKEAEIKEFFNGKLFLGLCYFLVELQYTLL